MGYYNEYRSKHFEYAATVANEGSFPAVGKNGKSIIVTGLTDFGMTKALNDAASLSYLTAFLLHARGKLTITYSIFVKLQRRASAIGQPPPPPPL